MVVLPSGEIDARRLRASGGIAAVGADQERRGQPASVLKSDRDSGLCSIDLCDARFPHEPAILPRFRARLERRAKIPVLVHEAERLVVVQIEIQAAGLEPVSDRDPADRHPGSARWSATPIVWSIRIELEETALVRPSKAASCRGAGSAGSITTTDNPLEIERGDEGQANETSTEDDHVRPVHRGRTNRFVAMTPRLRLTREVPGENSEAEILLGVGHGDRCHARAEA